LKKDREKILVLDDEISICLLLENFLPKNYEVVSVNSGLDALMALIIIFQTLLSAIFKCQIWTDMNFENFANVVLKHTLHYAVRKVRK
jgi:CheY-like chemotaxis protein